MSDINVVDHLKKQFGTQTRLALAAGIKQNSMSDRRKVNSLTHEQMRRIMKAAPTMGVIITPQDFFPEFFNSSEAA